MTASSLRALSSSFSGPELSQHDPSIKPCVPSFITHRGEWHFHPPSCPSSGLQSSCHQPLPQWSHIWSAIKTCQGESSSQCTPFFSFWHPYCYSLVSGPRTLSQELYQQLHSLSRFQSCPSTAFSMKLSRLFSSKMQIWSNHPIVLKAFSGGGLLSSQTS